MLLRSLRPLTDFLNIASLMNLNMKPNSFFSRLLQYLWFFFYIVLVQLLDQWRIVSLVGQSWSQEIHIFVLDCCAWALLLYTFVALIPWHSFRRVLLLMTIVVVAVLYLTDVYLLHTYSMPYEDTLAQPLLATNLNEAWEFLQSMDGSLSIWAVEVGYLLLVVLVSWLVSWSIRALLSSSLPIIVRRLVLQQRIRLMWAGLLVLVGLFIAQVLSLSKEYNNDWIRYNRLSLPGRLVVSDLFVRKEIRRSHLDYQLHPPMPQEVVVMQELPPHNVIFIYSQEIYPALLDCYKRRGVPNTPHLSARIEAGSVIRFDSAYCQETRSFMAALKHFSLAPQGEEQRFEAYPTIGSVLRLAGYRSYWLSNNPKVEPWLDLVPQMIVDCDSSYFTNLRASVKDWSKRSAPDLDVLKHLSEPLPGGKSLYQVVHLMGASGGIWSHTSRELPCFYRQSCRSEVELSGSEQDDLAQYYTIVLNQDHIVEEIIKYYQHTPTIVFFMGNMGIRWQPNPYNREQETEEELTHVPLLVYLSPEMKKIAPNWERSLRAWAAAPFGTEQFAYKLLELLGITYTKSDDLL